jgi:hypothetical protein
MIWLQSNEKYNVLAKYDHADGSYALVYKTDLANKSAPNTDGIFSFLSSVFVAIYKYDQQLFLRIGGKSIPLTNDTVVTVGGDVNNRVLTIGTGGSCIVSLNYKLDKKDEFINDPTPFIENEDFDFGIFLTNISMSDERKRVLLGLE